MTKKKKLLGKKKGVGKFHWILLALLILGAFAIRVVPQWDQVVTQDGVIFKEVDDWYHMRLADNMLHNFPIPLKYDNYATLGGIRVVARPLMSWLIAGPEFIRGKQIMDFWAALLPPILGTLTLIPVFLIGITLFTPGVGLISCLLLAVLPNEFLHRTLLGFPDHHALEAFLAALLLLFLVLFEKNRKRRWSILSGVTLGLIFLNWHGGLLLAAIVGIWVLVYFALKVETGAGDKAVFWRKALPIFWLPAFTLLFYLLWVQQLDKVHLVGLLGMALLPFFLRPLEILVKKRVHLITILSSLGALGLILLFTGIGKSVLDTMKYTLWSLGTSIDEGQPTTLLVAFSCYGVSIVLFFVGLYFLVKKGVSSALILFTLIFLFLVIGQRRWGYYFAIPLSLVSAYSVYIIAQNFKRIVRPSLVGITVFFMVFPTILGTIGVASIPNLMDKDWHETCVWLRDNTPEPFKEDIYYELREGPQDPEYTVLSWWDYGHFIIRASHRVPLTSPSWQTLGEARDCKFFVAQDPAEAEEVLKDLKVKYVVIDQAMVTGKFYAMFARWMAVPPTPEFVMSQLPNSEVCRIWRGELPNYKLRFESSNGLVKVFERLLRKEVIQ